MKKVMFIQITSILNFRFIRIFMVFEESEDYIAMSKHIKAKPDSFSLQKQSFSLRDISSDIFKQDIGAIKSNAMCIFVLSHIKRRLK